MEEAFEYDDYKYIMNGVKVAKAVSNDKSNLNDDSVIGILH